MDFIVLAIWGIVTGVIVGTGIGKKSHKNEVIQDVPVQQVVISEPASVEEIKPETIAYVPEKVEEKVVEVAEEVKNPVTESITDAEPETLQMPKVQVRLPKGLQAEQLLLNDDGTPKTHVLQRGESLTQLAHQYYLDARFWPYIYEVNRFQLSGPDKIQADMILYLPNPEFYGIDESDQKSIEKARVLIGKYQK